MAWCMVSLLILLSSFHQFHVLDANSSSNSFRPSCLVEESSALLQFKRSFLINASTCEYAKVWSWKPPLQGDNNTCCSWDGIECDEKTGHVIGLDLSSSCLHGSINSSSTLFRLVHLQSLNLADNDFNNSQIPATIRNLSRLRYLNLSGSKFSGLVPASVENLTQLTHLSLSKNFLGGHIPSSLGRQLIYLDLSINNFYGEIPPSLAYLTHLKVLSLCYNELTGYILSSLRNLTQITELLIGENMLTGDIPSFLGYLKQLIYLDLSYNEFNGRIPPSLGNLTKLTLLSLGSNNLTGTIPSCLGILSRLTDLSVDHNELSGSIPQSLSNLRNLELLYLHNNNLSGAVEFHRFLMLQNLTTLDLSWNELELLNETSITNATLLPKFQYLRLCSCNIREFPNFIKYQETLQILDLSGNKLQGQVPKWMWNTSAQTLERLNISHNFLSGFDQPPAVLPWVNIQELDFTSNNLHGPLPIPQTTIQDYRIGDNKLVGEISSLICNMSNLSYLDLSNNKFSGVLPQCLGNSSNVFQVLILRNNNLTGKVSPLICNLSHLGYLDLSRNKLSGMLPQCIGNFSGMQYLNLGNNSFHGILPQTFTITSNLKMFDVSQNQFQGQLPRSLANCGMLEFLVLSNNQFDDVFPFWLGTLQGLKILAMRNNGFYGVIGQPKKDLHFPELRILDLSYNNFTGEFPTEYIFSGHAIRGISLTHEKSSYNSYGYYLQCSITITNKGIEIYYPQIQEDLVAIHISSNKFEGNIPEFIGKLKGLRLLNISNNFFTGCIPSSFGNLTLLESLDLSQNQLSGQIPQQLSRLSFLEKFNVSQNYLTGHIPGGTQFSTFDITSYEGNPGLCGEPLPKKCRNPEGVKLPPSTSNPEGSGIEVDWKFALAGLGSGLVVGVVLADVAIARWNEWFIEIVGILIRLVKRMRMCRK